MMTAFRKFVTPWKVLIAVVAICATAPPVKADLTLSFTDKDGKAFTDQSSSATTYSVSNGSTGTVNFDGLTIKYTVTDAYSSATATHSLAVKFDVTTPSQTSGNVKKDDFLWTLSGTNYTAPGNGPATLQALLKVDSSSLGTSNANDYLQLRNIRAEYDSGSTTKKTTKIDWDSTQSNPYGEYTSNKKNITVNPPYSLAALGGEFVRTKGSSHGTDSSTISFTATAQVIGVPEPSGVAMALAGLPCLGLVVGFARRRGVPLNPVNAA